MRSSAPERSKGTAEESEIASRAASVSSRSRSASSRVAASGMPRRRLCPFFLLASARARAPPAPPPLLSETGSSKSATLAPIGVCVRHATWRQIEGHSSMPRDSDSKEEAEEEVDAEAEEEEVWSTSESSSPSDEEEYDVVAGAAVSALASLIAPCPAALADFTSLMLL